MKSIRLKPAVMLLTSLLLFGPSAEASSSADCQKYVDQWLTQEKSRLNSMITAEKSMQDKLDINGAPGIPSVECDANQLNCKTISSPSDYQRQQIDIRKRWWAEQERLVNQLLPKGHASFDEILIVSKIKERISKLESELSNLDNLYIIKIKSCAKS